MMPSAVELLWISSTRATMLETELPGKICLSSVDEVARLVGPAGEAEQREREEEQRHEREQREVGDHRREVGAAVGEELRQQEVIARSMHCVSVDADGCGAGTRRPDRDLVADRGAPSSSTRGHRRSPRRSATTRGGRLAAARRSCCAAAEAQRAAEHGGRASSRSATGDGSVFVVRDGERVDRGDHRPRADRGPRLLRPEELPAQRSAEEEPAKPKPQGEARSGASEGRPPGRSDASRRFLTGFLLAAGSAGRHRPLPPPRGAPPRARRRSTSTTARWSRSPRARPRRDAPARRSRASVLAAARGVVDAATTLGSPRSASTPTSRATSSSAPAAARATTSTSTASRPGPTCSRALGERIAAAVRPRSSPTRRASPARSSAPSRSPPPPRSRRGLPFLIVREEAKEYGTANRLEGVVRGGRARLPRRGRRHLGRRGARGGRGAARGGARVPHGRLRRRSGGGRRGRARARRRAAAAALPCGRSRPDVEKCRKTAWLSGIDARC